MTRPEGVNTTGPAVQPRPAAQILGDLAALERSARRAKAAPMETREQALRRKAELIGELYQADPGHRKLPGLLIERWLALRDDPVAVQEHEKAEALPRGDPRGDAAWYVTARLAIEDGATDSAGALGAIETLAGRSSGPTSRVPELLVMLADRKIKAVPDRVETYRRCLSGFPGSPYAGLAEARLTAIDAEFFKSVIDPSEAGTDVRIGKPFEFAFQDVVSGQLVSSDGLKGRVLVIDFWGTWCPPCVEAIPHLKAVNEKFGPADVTIIGINVNSSPDKGGLRTIPSK
jgi:thiol-disulfide isomerase/thioredoxin